MRTRLMFIVLIAGTLLLAACGGQGAADNNGEVIITLTDFGIESSVTEFKVGVPYRFTVTNTGLVEHEFMIMPPVAGSSTPMEGMDMGDMDMAELDELALAMIPASNLQPGDTAILEYTFTEPAPAGTFELACHTPGHYEAGMIMPIVVK